MAVFRGDFGPYWEDGYGSDAAPTAIHRENQHRILTAEVLGSSVSSVDPRVHSDRGLAEDAWRNELLYDEHTWTYVGATTEPEHHQSEDQIALKRARVLRARDDINESIQRGWAQLEALVKPKENSIAVFNSLNWPRSGLIETDIPADAKIIDPATGGDVGFEVLWKGNGIALPGFGPGNVRVRFVAANVPAVGYKLYTVKIAAAVKATPSFPLSGNVVENQFYRIRLDLSSGAVASIFDKQLGRELVDQHSPYRFGSYLYVTGGDDYPNNSLYRFGAGLKPPALTIHPAHSDNVLTAVKTPLGAVVRLTSFAPNTPSIQTEILLLDGEKKILITYRLHKDRVLSRESAYIAFPFDVSNPQFTYGSQSGWINPRTDELAGGSREWYLPTTWAAVFNPQVVATVVPLDAPLAAFGDIVRADWPAEFQPKSSAIYSWLMNNYWGTNFPAWQGGDFIFRYAITTSAEFDPAAATRFGWNALTPLERDDVSASPEASALPNEEASLLEIGDPGVTLLTWKPAEDLDGSILRIQESAGKSSVVNIESKFLSFEQAWLCNAVEDNQLELTPAGASVSVPIQAFQVLTIRVRTKPHLERGDRR
jgi:alpha-mannosidase